MGDLRALSIALVVSAFMSAAVYFMTRTSTANTDDIRYGAQAGDFVARVRQFATANRTNIINAVAAGGGNAVIYSSTTTPTLVASMSGAGVLDPSNQGTTVTGGTWCLEFRTYALNSITYLQGALTVVGETAPLNAIDAATAAQNAGTSNTGVIDSAAANIVYPAGSQALSAFTGPKTCVPAANALGIVITDGDSIGTTDKLSRVPVPGNPSANTWATDENLGQNNINNVASITVTGSGSVPAAVTSQGVVTAATSMTAPIYYHVSDKTLKHQIEAVPDPWRLLAPIAGNHWLWDATNQPDYGVVADDVETTMPELVSHDRRGKKVVNYDGLFGPVIAGLKDLHMELDAARAEISADHVEIARLRAALVQEGAR